MKKNFVVCAGLFLVLALVGCKSSESAYKKAYEKAKASETSVAQTEETVVETPVVTPMVETPATRTTVVTSTSTNVENEAVRTEELSVVDGAALKNYSVVVGSFSLKANAEGLAKTLRSSGYESRIAYNAGRNMYRVVASSFNTKADAVVSRDQLRAKYPDAWLLFQK